MFVRRPVAMYGADYEESKKRVLGARRLENLELLRAVRVFLEPQRWVDELTADQVGGLHVVNESADFEAASRSFERDLAYAPVLSVTSKDDGDYLLCSTFCGTVLVLDVRSLGKGGSDVNECLPWPVRRALESRQVLKLGAGKDAFPGGLRIECLASVDQIYETLVDRFVIRPAGEAPDASISERASAWCMLYHARPCTEQAWTRLFGGHG